MSFSGFQKDAKKKLDDYRPEIDAEAFWMELEPQVKEDKKKRRVFLWLFFGLLLGAGVLLGSYYFMSDTKKISSGASAASSSIINTKALSNTDQTLTQKESPKLESPKPNNNSEASSTTADLSNTPAPINATVASSDTKASTITTTTAKNIKPLPTNTSSHKQPSPKPITASAAPAKKAKASTPLSTETVIDETPAEAPKVLETQKTATQQNATALPKAKQWLKPLEKLPARSIKFLAQPSQSEQPIAAVEAQEEASDRIYRRKKNWKTALGIKAGWGRLNQDLKDLGNSNSEYLAARLATETELEELNLGLGFELFQRRGLYLQTGLEYTRLATKSAWTSTQTQTEQKGAGILKIYTNANTGDTTFVYGPIEETTTIESTRIRYNNFHLLQIPLTAGFRWQQEAWSLGIEAGVQFNAYLQQKGAIEGLNEELYDLKKDEATWFKSQLGIRATTALHLGYAISPQWRIVASPRYHFPLKVNTNANPLQQQFSSLGLSLGIWCDL